ncbi:MAG: hypothetical protein JWM68_4183 [Verrucomicrobiales bacterium]|nr:hypothetical protein [Verrucomicrobiales bacterium]
MNENPLDRIDLVNVNLRILLIEDNMDDFIWFKQILSKPQFLSAEPLVRNHIVLRVPTSFEAGTPFFAIPLYEVAFRILYAMDDSIAALLRWQFLR